MLNFELLKHPLNWFTVWLMLLLAALAGHLVLRFFESEESASE